MKHKVMRSLPAPAQEERRRQVIGLRESGMTLAAIGQQVDLSCTGVFNICQRYQAAGAAGLRSQPPGPPMGTGRVLSAGQEAEICALIRRRTPDALGLPFALWSRPAVRMLIQDRYGIPLAVRSTGRYLARWHFTVQKPLRRAYEQRPSEVKRWLKQEYPMIAARSHQQDGVILWGDETGLRSDDVRGRSYAPRGCTPVVRPSHKRAGVGLISAVSNKGVLRWMVLERAITAPVLIVIGCGCTSRRWCETGWPRGRIGSRCSIRRPTARNSIRTNTSTLISNAVSVENRPHAASRNCARTSSATCAACRGDPRASGLSSVITEGTIRRMKFVQVHPGRINKAA
jgi:transposase